MRASEIQVLSLGFSRAESLSLPCPPIFSSRRLRHTRPFHYVSRAKRSLVKRSLVKSHPSSASAFPALQMICGSHILPPHCIRMSLSRLCPDPVHLCLSASHRVCAVERVVSARSCALLVVALAAPRLPTTTPVAISAAADLVLSKRQRSKPFWACSIVLLICSRLADYMASEPERKKAVAEARKAKLEALEKKLGIDPSGGASTSKPEPPKRRFDDTAFLEETREIVDGVKDAVAAGKSTHFTILMQYSIFILL